ncbi:MAG: L-fucose:H+ symporter permease [Bacteroidota bacterium]
MTTPSSNQRFAVILITSLFFLWGISNNMTDTLLAAFKRIMSMTDFQTSWIQVAFYGSYFCLAIPAALLIKRYAYKTGILVGLGMFIAGSLLFYPASMTKVYGHFLAALFVLAGGLSILETSANPYIFELGPAENAVQRLNLAQSFNPIGSITGVILSKFFILSQLNQASEAERALMSPEQLIVVQDAELSAVMGPYVGLALLTLVIWFAIFWTPMPKGVASNTDESLTKTIIRLLRRPTYRRGVLAQFFYVGAQIGVWSFTIRYVMQELRVAEDEAASYYLAALVLFTVSRFVCTALMRRIAPARLLAFAAGIAIALTAVVIFASGTLGVLALVGISACMSLMFPTIYGLSIDGLGADTKIGGSLLVMAILGGAVLTAVQGQVSDWTQNIHYAFFVPLLCFAYVGYYGLTVRSATH